MKLTKIGEFLNRSKIPIDIEDEVEYNRVTIRINHNGVSLRDSELGRLIGTKKQFILKSGQFIVSKIDARYGAFGIAPVEVDNAIITGNFWAYDVDTDLINIDWFNQFTNSPVFYEVCERASSGITHRKYLDEKFFLNYQILLPSVEEQLTQIEKINSQKVSFCELSTELTHQLTLVKKLRQQLLQDAVQGKLAEQNKKDEPASELLKKIKAEKAKLKKGNVLEPISEASISYSIPKNWIWCRFGEVIQMTRGKFSIRPRNDPSYFGGEYPFIQIGSLDEKGSVINEAKQTLNEKGIKVSKKFPKNTIAIAIVGGTIGNLGVLGREMYFTDSIIGILPNQFYNQEFILNYLRYKQPEIKSEAYQMAGQPNIKIPTLENLLFPMPPLEEQKRIVQKLDELMQYCNELEASIKQSESQNEKLLQQVLREALRKEPVEV